MASSKKQSKLSIRNINERNTLINGKNDYKKMIQSVIKIALSFEEFVDCFCLLSQIVSTNVNWQLVCVMFPAINVIGQISHIFIRSLFITSGAGVESFNKEDNVF